MPWPLMPPVHRIAFHARDPPIAAHPVIGREERKAFGSQPLEPQTALAGQEAHQLLRPHRRALDLLHRIGAAGIAPKAVVRSLITGRTGVGIAVTGIASLAGVEPVAGIETGLQPHCVAAAPAQEFGGVGIAARAYGREKPALP